MADETTGNPADGLVQDAAGAATGADSDSGSKKGAADTIREEAAKFGDQAKERARAFAGEGKDRATSALDEVANLMRSAAGDVDARLGEQYGQDARTAADGIAGFADSLRGKEVEDLLSDATEFVRKSPAIAVGTAAALGFVMARLIKSGMDAAGQKAPETTGTPEPEEPAAPAASPLNGG